MKGPGVLHLCILQLDSNHVLFNNRAQAHLRLENYGKALEDAVASIKLNPSVVKTCVIMARALRGQKAYYKALEVLQTLQREAGGLNEAEREVIRNLEEDIRNEIKHVEENIKRLKKIT
ncbi:Uncharacterized protein FKW44_014710 [Caligus rogercresseyi]|uniref:Uncharacterized protein n=1 Tax=Caligus rogercresseyi TaxID=217165 RepID=A0A7T8GZA8_CALRO|nr:Uncharacterized protein FKW44_014710 [Caligus rogercresseyi]